MTDQWEDEIGRMGHLLIHEGLLTQEDIDEASKDPAVNSSGLAANLKKVACIRKADLAAFVGADYQVGQVSNPAGLNVSPEALSLLSADLAAKHQVLPVAKTRTILFALAANPSPEVAEAVRSASNLRVKLLQAPAPALKALIDTRYKQPATGRRVLETEPEMPAVQKPGEKEPAVAASADEKAIVELYMKLLREWEQTYTEGRAVPAIKVA